MSDEYVIPSAPVRSSDVLGEDLKSLAYMLPSIIDEPDPCIICGGIGICIGEPHVYEPTPAGQQSPNDSGNAANASANNAQGDTGSGEPTGSTDRNSRRGSRRDEGPAVSRIPQRDTDGFGYLYE